MNSIQNTLPVEKDARYATMRDFGSSSPARVLPLALACMFLIAISLCSMFVVRTAEAATWPVPTSELSASVTFRQTYTAGGKSYVHSGVDIPASAGMQISTPLAGTVRFTGAVPSGDSKTGGSSPEKTMQAVSIEVAGGRVITLMPFSTIDVAEGQAVAEGTRLGTLAGSGDASSAGAHVHMGYKNGRTYLDPMQLFGLSAHSQDATRESVKEAVAIAAPEAAHDMAAEQVISAPDPALQSVGEPGLALNPAQELIAESFGTIETGAYDWQPRVQKQVSLLDSIMDALRGLGGACYGQFVAFIEALGELSRGTGIPLPVVLGLALGLAAVSAILLVIVVLHLAMPGVCNVWRNQKRRLSTCAGGDSMHKLFPASGAAFMSRSRIARGR